MSKQKESEVVEDAASEEPEDIKRAATGVMLLVAVCSVLWVISKFGPVGADWLNAKTREITGVGTENMVKISEPPKPKAKTEEEAEPKPELETVKEAEVAGEVKKAEVSPDPEPAKAAPVAAVDPAPQIKAPATSKSSRVESARRQIEEALGGASKVQVRHIAISDDENSMVAAVKFIDSDTPKKLVEIYFSKDEYRRYKSDSSLEGEEIIIWEE